MSFIDTDDAFSVAARRIANSVRRPNADLQLPVQSQPQPTTYIIEPDLMETQTGNMHLPQDVAFDDVGNPYNTITGKPVKVVRRPNVLPIAKTPEGFTFAMPKMLDIAGNVMSPLAAGRVPVKAGEVVLGSGAVRTINNDKFITNALNEYNKNLPSIKDQYYDWAGKDYSYNIFNKDDIKNIYGEDIPENIKNILNKNDEVVKISSHHNVEYFSKKDAPSLDTHMKEIVSNQGGMLEASNLDDIMKGLDLKVKGGEEAASAAFKSLAKEKGWEISNGVKYFNINKGDKSYNIRISNHPNLTRSNPNAVTPDINIAPGAHDFNDAMTLLSDTRPQVAGAPVKGAEAVLGSGVVRKVAEVGITKLEKDMLEFLTKNNLPMLSKDQIISNMKARIRSIEYDRRLTGKPEGEVYPHNVELSTLRKRVKELEANTSSDTLYSDTRNQVYGAVGHALEKKQQPFYSALERTVENAKIGKASPEQWLGYLKNQPGVKQEELAYVLKDLPEGQISKEALSDIIKNNKVELGEVVKENGQTKRFNNNGDFLERDINTGTTKYHDYQLPGGENYQEMLLTLPKKKFTGEITPYEFRKSAVRMYGEKYADNLSEAQKEIVRKDIRGEYEVSAHDYRSSHWDEPNILAHVRYNDRNIPEVGKSLHLEEIQSDWHQAGRKQGYIQKDLEALKANADTVDNKLIKANADDIMGNPDLSAGLKSAVDRKIITQKEADDYLRLTQNENSNIPDAPFKKNWDELAFKRMLHKAATEGYEGISWTPGEAQAARYDLSKQVDKIAVPMVNENGTRSVRIDAKGNSIPFKLMVDKNGIVEGSGAHSTQFNGKPLSDVVGKEMADKILKLDKPNEYLGEGLKIGGEGMKSFYDKMLVDKANALAKKYGAKVETNKPLGYTLVNKHGIESKGGKTLEEAEKQLKYKIEAVGDKNDWKIVPEKPVHVLKLTPELRAKAKSGFPLFSSTPITTPVDYDPFQTNKKYRLVPIQGNPFNE